MSFSSPWRYDQVQAFPPAGVTADGAAAKQFFAARPSWSAPERCGVVTAGDDCYFPGVQMLALSVAGRCPLCVFDLGLGVQQRGWLAGQGVRVVEVMESDLVVPSAEPMWQTWNKPAFLAASPFECSLWIDCDAFVVADLTPLFLVADRQPLVFRHPDPCFFQPKNSSGLYDQFPVSPRRVACGVQAAVVGVADGRDHGLLGEWQKACGRFRCRDVAGLVKCWDQGALLWALEKLDLGFLAREAGGWNRFAWPAGSFGLGDVKSFFDSFRPVLDDVILHFVGRPKYWVNWGKYVSLG